MPTATVPLETFSIDQALVGLILSPYELGLYVVGGAFGRLGSIVMIGVGSISLPRIASTPTQEAQRRLVWGTLGRATLLVAALATGTEVIVAWALPVFFGGSFAPALTVSRILIVAGFLLAIRRLLFVVLQALGSPGRGAVTELAGMAGLVILGLVLIPPLGLVGAGAAVLLVAGAADVYLLTATARILRASPRAASPEPI